MPLLSAPKLLTEAHQISRFDCGASSLNEWLRKWALESSLSKTSRTYVVTDHHEEVIGYYCLNIGAIGSTDSAKKLIRNTPDSILVLVLSRLAVHKDHHYKGIGKGLLRDAVLRSFEASNIAGVSTLLAHASTKPAKRFYLSNGFLESPIKTWNLVFIDFLTCFG